MSLKPTTIGCEVPLIGANSLTVPGENSELEELEGVYIAPETPLEIKMFWLIERIKGIVE